MNSCPENREKKIYDIRQRIKEKYYFTPEVTEIIAERLLKRMK